MLLANKHLTLVLGLDIHIITFPIGPLPIPHPFIGLVMDPMDYIPFVGSTVFINGVPRGISDTSGMLAIMMHIPMGGPFLLAPMIGHESVNFFGSLKVKAEDVALSPSGYMTMTCNDIGIPLSLSPGKKMKPIPSLFLPTSYSIPLPMGKPVMVGGPYAPDLLGILKQLVMSYAFGSILKGAGKLAKKAAASLKKAKSKFTKGLKSIRCRMGFEPVDLIDGRMVYEGTDFEIPGPIPIHWERRWYSDSSYQGPLGHGMHHNYDLALHIYPEEDFCLLILPDGRPATFPHMISEGDSFYNRSEKLSLTYAYSGTYLLKDHETQEVWTFRQVETDLFRPAQLTNPTGLSIGFTYQSGHLTLITDTAGRHVRLHLNKDNLIDKITLTHKNQEKILVSYRYNEAGDLIRITDPLDQSTHMRYSNHLMVAKTDRNGQTFYWEYDGPATGARCIHTWGDGGILEGWIEYGKGKNTVTNSLGHKTIYYYDENNLCTQVTDPDGNHTFHEYTEYMEPYRNIDQEGNITGYTYDDRGNLTGIVQPDGSTVTRIYNEDDRIILSISPGGGSTVRVYNDRGLLHSLENPDGKVTSFEYNTEGLPETIRNNQGHLTKLEYDEDHNLISAILPDKAQTTWTYDPFGLCTGSTDPEKRTKHFSYDELGRPCQIDLPDGNHIQLTYNAYNEVLCARDRDHCVNFTYTPMGSLKSREENGVKIQFHYDTEEQLRYLVNEHGETYRFARNAVGHIIQETGFDGLTRRYLRDRAGKVLKTERPGGRHTTYEYDLNGRIVRAEHSDGSWETYSYNRDGQLIEAVNENSRLVFHRDKNGRILKEEQDGYLIESQYDKSGNRVHIQSSLGADIQLTRNTSGFVEHMIAGRWEASIRYNALGQETERLAPNVRNQFSYDQAGRVREQKTSGERGRLLRHKQYHWGVNDKLHRIHDLISDTSQTFEYDHFDNLIRSIAGTGDYDNYFRDEVGNIFKNKDHKDRKYSAGGKLTESGQKKYLYDEEGNLTEKETPDGCWKYEWGGNGMLRSVLRPDGKSVIFEYDALGRRTAKIFDNTITRWLWDGNTPLHEWKYTLTERPISVLNENGMLVKDREEPVENLITWVFDEGSFKPAARIASHQACTIISDYLGTPKEAYNQSGEKVWACELAAYGEVKSCTGGEGFIPFRFQGQYHDVETGLYYNRFRYYAPEEAAYISQDPIRLAGNNPTLYGYVFDINSQVDVYGLSIMDDAWSVVQTHMNDSGKTVLGHFPRPGETFDSYIDKAVKKGASYFDMGSLWDDIIAAGEDPWVLNKRFLDETIANGDDILLNVPKSKIRPGSYLEREIDCLLKNGYKWVNQWSLRKVCS